VASILGMKGITITKDSSSSSPSNGVPNSLINIKGITVQKVSDDVKLTGSPVTGMAPRGRGPPPAMRGGATRPTMQQANIARQQDQAIERWSNACEHGCRLCRSQGKNFSTFHRNQLVKHLESEHRVGEREYKEEFKCQNLITRAANLTCAQCKHKVKRIPTSLSPHLKKHGMTIRQYWMKHVAPKGSALATYSASPAFRAQQSLARGVGPARGFPRGGPVPRGGRGGFTPAFRGTIRPQIRPNVVSQVQQKAPAVNGNGPFPKVMLNRVDDDTIAREEAGLGDDDAMEVELDPLTLLEMGMGDDVIQLEGVAVKEEVDSAEEGDEAVAPLQITPDLVEDHMDEGEEAKEQDAEDSRDLVTPEVYEENTRQESQNGDPGGRHLEILKFENDVENDVSEVVDQPKENNDSEAG